MGKIIRTYSNLNSDGTHEITMSVFDWSGMVRPTSKFNAKVIAEAVASEEKRAIFSELKRGVILSGNIRLFLGDNEDDRYILIIERTFKDKSGKTEAETEFYEYVE